MTDCLYPSHHKGKYERYIWGMVMIENLEYFKVFYYTAKLGSVTKAANELAISQPAVSQSLKQLEKSLDVVPEGGKGNPADRRGAAVVFLCGKGV